MNATDYEVKQWSPKLIRVTLIPNLNHAKPKAYAGFINPLAIISIARGFGNHAKNDSMPVEYWPAIECTEINLGTAGRLLVEEPPEHIAQLRDRALELQTTLQEVK